MMKALCKFAKVVVCTVCLVSIQNCAQSGFESVHSGANSSSSFSTGDDLLKVENISFSDGTMPMVQVFADLDKLGNVKSAMWDNIFENDLTFCQQTTSVDKRRTGFLCPGTGVLTVYLLVTLSDGSQRTLSRKISVDEGTVTPGPGATQGPLDGATLYTQNCSGCHGALAGSTKRGISLSMLNSALNSIGQMSFLRSQLSDAEKQAIVDALR
jgi:hypothetical protein